MVFSEIELDQGQSRQDDQRSRGQGPQENTRRSQDIDNLVNFLFFSHSVLDRDVEFTPVNFSIEIHALIPFQEDAYLNL